MKPDIGGRCGFSTDPEETPLHFISAYGEMSFLWYQF